MNIKKMFLESTYEVDLREKVLQDFCVYCCQQLQLNQYPKLKIVSKREGEMTTGVCIPEQGIIKVYGGTRLVADICRTIAHELTHYRQYLQGKIKSYKRDWDLEAEADIEAGKMVYNFAHTTTNGHIIYEI